MKEVQERCGGIDAAREAQLETMRPPMNHHRADVGQSSG